MASLSTYFIKDKNKLIANKSNIIQGKKYRFTVLSPRLIRLEYSPNGIFEDRASSLVINRDFEKNLFYVTESDTLLEVKTTYFTLTYVKNKPFMGNKFAGGSTLKVVLNNTEHEWYYGQPEARNFGGSNYSLDDFNKDLKLNKGLFSSDGFVMLDDSDSYILTEKDEFIPRENKVNDLYLFMYKRDFGNCLKDYFTLTGYPSFIPRYALGNWWYKNETYTINDVNNIINKFKDNNIPLSIFLLGNKWHSDPNNFMFNNKLIDVNELNNLIKSNNLHLGVTVNPELGINSRDINYENIEKYLPSDKKDINLLPLDMMKLGLYFNFYIRILEKQGVDIFNIDYNNPSDKLNLWLLNHYHYAESNSNRRGIILSRNAGIAAHRYPILYSGKTKVSWNTLNTLPFYNSSASNMGISWQAHAIGGFYGGMEDSELYLRYIQFATFSPIFLLASEAGKYYKREPWKWSASDLSIIKEYMSLRYKLIPYLYNEAFYYHKNGIPIIQPLYYQYPSIYDEPLYKNQYFLGKKLLVAPITKKKNIVMNRVVQKVFVPEGIWYDFKSGKKYLGNKYYVSFYKDEDYPVFCKAGSIIPLSNDNTSEIPKNMDINVFPGLSGSYELYEDDGISYEYQKGNYLITSYNFITKDNQYSFIMNKKDGNDKIIDKRNYKIRFRNMKKASNIIVKVNNENISYRAYTEKTDFIIEVKDINISSQLTINIAGDNLLVEAVQLINEDILGIIEDLEIDTLLKEKIDDTLFSNLPIKKKRIAIRKLKKSKLEPKFIKMFLNLLEYIEQV